MSVLSDLAGEFESYIRDSVSLDIVDVSQPGDFINVLEIGSFQARVINNGELNMTSVSLDIDGKNGTLVSTAAAGPWSSSITVNGLTVNAKTSRDSTSLYFKAPAEEKPALTTLVSCHVRDWKANLDYIFTNRTKEENAKFGHLNREVHPS
jgi:hypothetical protein